MLRIRSKRLPRSEVAIPERELTGADDLACDLFGGVVVAGEIALKEVAGADENVAEEYGGDCDEKNDRGAIGATGRSAARALYLRSSTPLATNETSLADPSALRVSFAPSRSRWSASFFERVFTTVTPSARAVRPFESVGTKKP